MRRSKNPYGISSWRTARREPRNGSGRSARTRSDAPSIATSTRSAVTPGSATTTHTSRSSSSTSAGGSHDACARAEAASVKKRRCMRSAWSIQSQACAHIQWVGSVRRVMERRWRLRGGFQGARRWRFPGGWEKMFAMNAPDSPFKHDSAIAAAATAVETKVIGWRRDFHEFPELGNHELRTAKIVADHLRSLGMEVKEKVAHTGVVGLLKGARPGPVVALRADMDALPVVEEVDVPFRSKVQTEWNGVKCGAMHACGHDAHTAILMG